jgi:hypothetical protein
MSSSSKRFIDSQEKLEKAFLKLNDVLAKNSSKQHSETIDRMQENLDKYISLTESVIRNNGG